VPPRMPGIEASCGATHEECLWRVTSLPAPRDTAPVFRLQGIAGCFSGRRGQRCQRRQIAAAIAAPSSAAQTTTAVPAAPSREPDDGAQIIVTRQSDLAVVFQSGVHLDDIEHLELTLPPLEKMIHSVHVHLLDLFPGLPLQERVLAMRHERMMVLGKVQTLN